MAGQKVVVENEKADVVLRLMVECREDRVGGGCKMDKKAWDSEGIL